MTSALPEPAGASQVPPLFGTDGIRGEAGQPPLDERTVRALGAALAAVLARRLGRPARIVMGRDTRESGPDILRWLSAGLAAAGAQARSAGVVPTPAVSWLARQEGFDAGVMVSASHNPWRDNGVKLFSHLGIKLDDALERAIEAEVAARPEIPGERREAPADEPGLRSRHGEALFSRFGGQPVLAGMRLVIDCAHGAASDLAAAVFERLGARAKILGSRPDGRNINEGCGSVHPQALATEVLATGAQAGIAFDGDADRCLLVDELGRIMDGDHVLLICADDLRARGLLRGGGVVGTVMSNFGLERALKDRGLRLIRERVGDRYVLERMQREGCNLGGEPSGHVIFLDDEPTGDGQLTALAALAAMTRSGWPLSRLADQLPRLPQVLLNVRLSRRTPLDQVRGHEERVRSWASRLGDDGRLVVRWSGTERLVRVMAEGTDEDLVGACARDIAGHLEQELGGAG